MIMTLEILQNGSIFPHLSRPSLKIAHVISNFLPYRSGTANVCFYNSRELVKRGHEVHVFTANSANLPTQEMLEGIRIHRLSPLLQVGNAPVLHGLYSALRNYDLIHLHYPFFGGEEAALASVARRIPLFITYHQDVLLHGPLSIIEKVLRYSTGLLTLRHAERLLFTSADYGHASYIRPLVSGRGSHISVLPNGTDTTRFTPAPPPESLIARYGFSEKDRIVLLVAGLDRAHYFKGVNILIQALTSLPMEVKAVIVGDGDLRQSYRDFADQMGLNKRVVFAGRIEDDELPDYYRLAHVTVLPSVTMGEAFGLVLLESLASGTPVIASNLPGVRTVVDVGNDGLLIPPGNANALATAILAILDDEVGRRMMGERGRAKVKTQYDWGQIGVQLERIYLDVVRRDQ